MVRLDRGGGDTPPGLGPLMPPTALSSLLFLSLLLSLSLSLYLSIYLYISLSFSIYLAINKSLYSSTKYQQCQKKSICPLQMRNHLHNNLFPPHSLFLIFLPTFRSSRHTCRMDTRLARSFGCVFSFLSKLPYQTIYLCKSVSVHISLS